MKTPNKPAAAADPAPDFTGDEHWGRGGRYIVVDGKRVPAPPEADAADVPADQSTVKENRNG